jgi:hypothetical protein
MEKLLIFLIVGIVIASIYKLYRRSLITKRTVFIENYKFPKKVAVKVLETYPHLTEQQVHQILDGLREYFHICNIAGKKMVTMPSQVVDIAWHEHILFTQSYACFCRRALGRFLHHTPAEAMRKPTSAQEGIKRAWKISCSRENISTKTPETLPLLFALDTQLNIPDGFKYTLNCPGSAGSYCATHIGCSSGCASDSSNDDGGSNDGCSSGCSSGDCGD